MDSDLQRFVESQTSSDHKCFTPNQSEYCMQGWLYYKGEMKALCQCACHAWEEAPDGP